ncbi:MAG TPA: hypothetical protein VHO06_05600 [Polyangia bacterium]|nr:hypothetical protein [Polyangia bacterium]
MRPAKPRAIEEIVSDGDRIDLTLEAMVGARWLLMFASESLRDPLRSRPNGKRLRESSPWSTSSWPR